MAQNRPKDASPKKGSEWNKSGLAEFFNQQSAWRKFQDKRDLKKLYNEAAKSPLMQEALDWAQAHGVEIIIDRKMTNSWGVYYGGTGILALSAELFDKEKNPEGMGKAVDTVTHEIRHAWQDYHRLLPSATLGFTEAVSVRALFEADAHAHGMIAKKQWENTQEGLANSKFTPAVRTMAMQFGVRNWFAEAWPFQYGVFIMLGAVERLGIKPANPTEIEKKIAGLRGSSEREFSPTDGRPDHTGLDPWRREDLEKLGRGFNGGSSYFTGWFSQIVQTDVMLPSHAAKFLYQTDTRTPYPTAQEVIKEEKRRAVKVKEPKLKLPG